MNGDGYDDLIMGATYGYSGGLETGAAYVVFGHGGAHSPDFDVSALNGSNGFRINGAVEYGHLGQAVSGAGDLNGDGFADVVVGAPATAQAGANSGASYVVFGGTGFTGQVDVSALDGDNGFSLFGTYDQRSGKSFTVGAI